MTAPARLVAVAPDPRLRRGSGRVGDRPVGTRRLPVLSLAFLLVWWFTLGPVGLGGPATFVIVDGSSMLPTYRDGDLVIARERVAYAIGDVIVFAAPRQRRYVIHRIAGGDAVTGWTTRGDNNLRDDGWSVPDEAVLGREWLVLPRVGTTVAWTQQHPLVFAAAVGLLVTLSAGLERRRRRPHPDLAALLAGATRIPGRTVRPAGDVVLLVAAGAAALSAVVSLARLAWTGLLGSPAGGVAVALLAVAGVVAVAPARRLGRGHGLPEPAASRLVLAGLCWAVEALPDLAELDHVDHADARALRAVADRGAGRVLRRTEHLGDAGLVRDTYLTVDADGVAHRWVAEGPDPARAEAAVDVAAPVDIVPVARPAAPVAAVVATPPTSPAPTAPKVPAPVGPALVAAGAMRPTPVAVTFDRLEDRLDAVRVDLERRLAGLLAGATASSSVRI